MSDLTVVPGAAVELHFTLRLTDGNVIDTTENAEPARMVVGDGQLPEGFERHLLGLRGGEHVRVEIAAAQAFGPRRIENVRRMARSQFGRLDLEEGTIVSFAEPTGTELPGVVQSVEEEAVLVDFNHPLAGRTIDFEAFVVSVKPPVGEAVSGT